MGKKLQLQLDHWTPSGTNQDWPGPSGNFLFKNFVDHSTHSWDSWNMQSVGRPCWGSTSEMLPLWTKILLIAATVWCLDHDIKAGRMLQLIQEEDQIAVDETHTIQKRAAILDSRYGPNSISLRWGDKVDFQFKAIAENILESKPKKLHMRLGQDQVNQDSCKSVGLHISPSLSVSLVYFSFKESFYIYFALPKNPILSCASSFIN